MDKCYRCGRVIPAADLVPAPNDTVKCDPDGPFYDECMRLWTSEAIGQPGEYPGAYPSEDDETPTRCGECGRVRPRFSMDGEGDAWVCSPANAMRCGPCGKVLVHYTEDEHRHGA